MKNLLANWFNAQNGFSEPKAARKETSAVTSHLKEYLDYYNTCDDPGYAVLVTGEWGTGKTFQVKQALNEKDSYYVSLFGLQTASDVYSEVFAAVDPQMAKVKSVLKDAGDTAKDMGGLYALGGLIPGMMNTAIRHELKIDRTLVFDDLERCGLKLKEILGVINTYVEHRRCRVIVIAHDKKTEKGFGKAKEKLFGQTIKVGPQIIPAFKKFCGNLLTSEKRDFVATHRDNIVGIFKASNVKSLRVLRHVIEDLARLHEKLSEVHLSNVEAMKELVGLFTAINIEVRSHNLTESDLKDRARILHGYNFGALADRDVNPEMPRLKIADEKYTSVDLADSLLQDQTLIQMFIEGRYDQDDIRNSINNSPFFLEPEDAPPWKIVGSFGKLEDCIVAPAADQMKRQLENREVTDSGEMLHIFSLRMMMADKGIIDGSISDEADSAKEYIDDLLADGLLPPRETDLEWRRSFDHSHDGILYWVNDTTKTKFDEILSHLIAARERALENHFPNIILDILKLVREDGRAFSELVRHTNNGDNPYALIPILSHIPAQDFVDAWLGSPVNNWRFISSALKARYEGRRLIDELNTERAWVREVVELLKAEATKADGFKALRVERTIPVVPQNLEE